MDGDRDISLLQKQCKKICNLKNIHQFDILAKKIVFLADKLMDNC